MLKSKKLWCFATEARLDPMKNGFITVNKLKLCRIINTWKLFYANPVMDQNPGNIKSTSFEGGG